MNGKNDLSKSDLFVQWIGDFLKSHNKKCCEVEKIPDLTPEQAKENEVPQTPPDLVVSNGAVPLQGLLIFYVNVGCMPPCNVEAYLKRMKESYKAALDRIPETYAVLWVPRRPSNGNDATAVELVRF